MRKLDLNFYNASLMFWMYCIKEFASMKFVNFYFQTKFWPQPPAPSPVKFSECWKKTAMQPIYTSILYETVHGLPIFSNEIQYYHCSTSVHCSAVWRVNDSVSKQSESDCSEQCNIGSNKKWQLPAGIEDCKEFGSNI